jgi:hypothetical protein
MFICPYFELYLVSPLVMSLRDEFLANKINLYKAYLEAVPPYAT